MSILHTLCSVVAAVMNDGVHGGVHEISTGACMHKRARVGACMCVCADVCVAMHMGRGTKSHTYLNQCMCEYHATLYA